jgi:GAF domain-containing protein
MRSDRFGRIERILADIRDEAVGAGREATLEALCAACARTLRVSWVGLASATGRGGPMTLASSGEAVRVLEQAQFTLGEGPCLEVFAAAQVRLCSDLARSGIRRWPAYAPAALGAGAHGVFAFPLRIGGICLGALEVYRRTPGPMDDLEMAEALAYADAATILVLQLRSPTQAWQHSTLPSVPERAPRVIDRLTFERLAHVFVALADTMVADFGVIEFLHRLVDANVQLLDVQAAGLMLVDERGVLHLTAWTDGRVEALGLLELRDGHGPSPDCFTKGWPVVNVAPEEASARWPRFFTAARRVGFVSAHALPMQLRGERIGAVGLFCAERVSLTDVEVSLAQALADVATVGLLQARLVREKTVLAEQLQTALSSRVLIEQAKGALAERAGLDVNAAFSAMRDYARRHGQTIRDVAARVLDGTLADAVLNRSR